METYIKSETYKHQITYIEVELTEEETQFLLNNDFVKFNREGREFIVVYMQDDDAYDIAEVIQEHSIKFADI